MTNVILSVLAHPDDAEFLCAGTLIRLRREHGWDVHIASMTAGDCGSLDLGPEAISQTRRAEGAAAARLIGGTYHCLEEKDLRIFYNERALDKVVRLLRREELRRAHDDAHHRQMRAGSAGDRIVPAGQAEVEDLENTVR